MPSGIYIRTEKHRKIISRGLIGNQNALGHGAPIGNKNGLGVLRSDKTKKNISKGKKINWKNPTDEMLSAVLRNSKYGVYCISDDGLSFPSLQERDCYYWIRDDVDEVMMIEHPFGRIDFLLTLWNGAKIALEYHPKFANRETTGRYYKNRRKLLDEIGYKDLKLLVMTSLKDEEKERVKRELYE